MDHIIAFAIYSYAGATMEHLRYFFSNGPKKELSNPIITGFPLYGIGAYLVIIFNDLLNKSGIENIIVKFAVFGAVLSVLEYIVGLIVGAGKNSYKNGMVVSWDYSHEPFNINGIISLNHFFLWGIVGIILIHVHYKLLKRIQCAIKCN